MTLGPLEYLVIGFEGNRFTGQILRELRAARENGIIRVVDLFLLRKDESGDVAALELSDLSSEEAEHLAPLAGELLSLLTPEDIEQVARDIPNNCAACRAGSSGSQSHSVTERRRRPMFRAGMARRMVRRRAIIGTAAVGGVAYAAGHHMATKSAEQQNMDAQQNAQIADLQQQPAPPPLRQQPVYQQPAPPRAAYAPAPSGGAESDVLEQLKQLGALRDSKVLTEAEFETAKRKILGDL